MAADSSGEGIGKCLCMCLTWHCKDFYTEPGPLPGSPADLLGCGAWSRVGAKPWEGRWAGGRAGVSLWPWGPPSHPLSPSRSPDPSPGGLTLPLSLFHPAPHSNLAALQTLRASSQLDWAATEHPGKTSPPQPRLPKASLGSNTPAPFLPTCQCPSSWEA